MKESFSLGHTLAFARRAGIALGIAGVAAAFTACNYITLDVSNRSGCCGCCDNGCGGDGASVSSSSGEATSTGAGGATGAGGSGGSGGSTGAGGEGGCLNLGEGCGGKPKFGEAPYTGFGKIVIGTNYADMDDGYVLGVSDISTVPPPDTSYVAPSYHHASWTRSQLGHVFGLTLDGDGNVYTTVTAIYNESTPLSVYANPGTIWRIDTNTANPSVFAKLPNKGPALGNINYACRYKMFYVTNFEDGRIYRLDLSGNMIETFDHATGAITAGGLPEPGDVAGEYAPLGERPWGVQVFQDRLYYALWNEDEGRPSATASNEIWSIALAPSGAFMGSPQLEIVIPPRPGEVYSNPVSDISFGPQGTMMLVERSMNQDGQSTAHRSRALEYSFCGGQWIPSGHDFSIGNYANQTNAAGGADYDFSPGGYAWFTGDALHFVWTDYIYGYQGTPQGGGDVTVSTLIDNDGDTSSGSAKTEIGDVEIPFM